MSVRLNPDGRRWLYGVRRPTQATWVTSSLLLSTEPLRDTPQLFLSSFLYISPSSFEVLYLRGGAPARSVLFYLVPFSPNRTTQHGGRQRVHTQVRPVSVIRKLSDALQPCTRELFILIVIVKIGRNCFGSKCSSGPTESQPPKLTKLR